jgi:hypothetical protein
VTTPAPSGPLLAAPAAPSEAVIGTTAVSSAGGIRIGTISSMKPEITSTGERLPSVSANAGAYSSAAA